MLLHGNRHISKQKTPTAIRIPDKGRSYQSRDASRDVLGLKPVGELHRRHEYKKSDAYCQGIRAQRNRDCRDASSPERRLPDREFVKEIRLVSCARSSWKSKSGPLPGHLFAMSMSRSDSGEIEPVKVHYLSPCRHKILHEFPFGILARVDFSEGAEFGVRTKDEVDAGSRPFDPA